MKHIQTNHAPAAIGPYTQAVVSGGHVYCSGQIALEPATGELAGITAAEQAEQVLQNLGAVLEAAGSAFDKAVKVTVFLQDMEDFGEVNEVYARYFTGKPARATVAVRTLPKDALVEIDCIAEL